jgi:hypothetical protein
LFYVYELIDPRDESVFYVGKGKKGRLDQHEVEARKGRQSRKCQRIRDIEAAGLKIGKRKVESFKDEMEAYAAEAALICRYGLASLTNAVPGGGGSLSRGPSMYEDRHAVIEAAKLFRRVHGVDLSKMMVMGREFDGSFMIPYMQGLIERIAKRRSLAWVNEIAAHFRVEFAPTQASGLI